MKLRNLMMGTALLLAACGDDDETPASNLDASVSDASLDATTPSDGAQQLDAGTLPAAEAIYVVGSSVSSADETSFLVTVGKSLDNSVLDPSKGLLVAGGGNAAVRDGKIYVSESVNQLITRYTYEDGALVKGPQLSFLNKGFQYFAGYFDVGATLPGRAFLVSDSNYKVFEWNPETMTLTGEYDISGLKKDGWGQEFRGSFLRSDGKLFLYWAYTNDRTAFVNEFTVGVFDTNSKTLSKVLTDPSCPITAGFGGYFDEQEDLYLIADNFGIFTKFNYPEPKEACILRIKKGSEELDPTFKRMPKTALGGREPWGLYYAGNGFAYTTAIDPAKAKDYASPYELIFAPVHTGWMLNVAADTAIEIKDIPPTGVGFAAQRVDGRLLATRTTGSVKIFDVEATQSTVYDIRTNGTATPLFAFPGESVVINRLR
jgi:hypothetical protein